MLGWEFPPHISGGLGTACRGLTDAMGRLKTRILFVLPRAIQNPALEDSAGEDEARDGLTSVPERKDAEVALAPVPSEVTDPYKTSVAPRVQASPPRSKETADPKSRPNQDSKGSSVRVMGVGTEDGYDGDLSRKIYDYADRCVGLTRRELFDVIHAHDWMTFPAAMAIAKFSGRPLIVHVHATEFDRSGEHINRAIYDIERRGMHAATRVIAVSERTKQIIVERYGVRSGKVGVVHNGIEFDRAQPLPARPQRQEKVVLFLGRITMQKGPEYFVRAAARVAEKIPHVKFVIAGTGDQLPFLVQLVDKLGLKDRVEFAGFLRGADVDRAYQKADVYAMPSVSEPFGLTALEAVRHGVPVVLSTSSGAAEVLKKGALKVDFWDVESMAKMISSVLEQPSLAEMLRREGAKEIRDLTWDEAAKKCIRFYHDAISRKASAFRTITSVAI
jgi:glycogen(starch) synthase